MASKLAAAPGTAAVTVVASAGGLRTTGAGKSAALGARGDRAEGAGSIEVSMAGSAAVSSVPRGPTRSVRTSAGSMGCPEASRNTGRGVAPAPMRAMGAFFLGGRSDDTGSM